MPMYGAKLGRFRGPSHRSASHRSIRMEQEHGRKYKEGGKVWVWAV